MPTTSGGPTQNAASRDHGSEDSDSKDSGGDLSSDAEGVWSPEIEQSFMEAMAIYPPCGRRKVMLSQEGKMYGRNELIARYIKLRTGKTRTRKQVSSHLQVLSRRKQREKQVKTKEPGEKVIPPAEAALNLHKTAPFDYVGPLFWQSAAPQPGISQDIPPMVSEPYASVHKPPVPAMSTAPFEGRSIATHKLRLMELSAFMEQKLESKSHKANRQKHLFVHLEELPSYTDPLLETVDIRQIHDKFPEKGGLKELYDKGPENAFYLVKFWADLNMGVMDEESVFYGVKSQFESNENMTLMCSTKVCSFGNIVVEKVKMAFARFESGKFVYKIRNPMCEYMINFICKLKHLPEKYMMNSVLENFTILEVVTNRDTLETLLCIAYVFEVSSSAYGTQHHIYRLVKD